MGKKKDKTGHQMGKHYGCTVMADGSIAIAPMYCDSFERLTEEELALTRMGSDWNNFLEKAYKQHYKKRTELWNRMKDEYKEFWPDGEAVYQDGIIKQRPPSKEEETA